MTAFAEASAWQPSDEGITKAEQRKATALEQRGRP
jgi:hypothetical protein